MTSKIKQMCKLCLETINDNSFETLEGDNKQILEVLLLQVDTESSERCIICVDCLDTLQKCFEFKSCCLYVEDYISPFIRNCTKIDIGQVLQKMAEVIIGTDIKLCRLCIDVVKDDSCIYLDQNESPDIVEAVRNCLPEVNVNAVFNPLICEKCVNCLREYSSFQKKCKKSSNFSKLNESDTDHINEKSSCLIVKDEGLQHTQIKDEHSCDPENGVFQTVTGLDDVTSINTVEDIKSEEIDINYEPLATGSCSVVKNERQQHRQIKNNMEDGFSCDSENEGFHTATDVNEVNNMNSVDAIKCEEIDIKNESLEDIGLSSTENRKTLSVTCNRTYGEATKLNDTLKRKDLNFGKITASNSEIKCKNRTEKNVSINLRRLEIVMYECNTCSYKTRDKRNLQTHMLIHADPSKVVMYKCNTCQYKTRRKGNLQSHMLLHMDPSETPMYECSTCRYKTQRKGDLQRHILIHMDPSKTEMYECNTCQFKTWWKKSLYTHMLIHKSPLETENYHCNTCPYKTRRKLYLQNHILTHINPSKIPMYECNTCSYKTRYKRNLYKHMLTHADPSKIVMHECNTCQFKTRWKGSLRSHMLLHIDPTKTSKYKCTSCRFKTSYKGNLERHKLIHKDPSKIAK